MVPRNTVLSRQSFNVKGSSPTNASKSRSYTSTSWMRRQGSPSATGGVIFAHPVDHRPRGRVHGDVLPHLEEVVAQGLVVDRVGAVFVVAVEQAFQLPLRDRGPSPEREQRKKGRPTCV